MLLKWIHFFKHQALKPQNYGFILGDVQPHLSYIQGLKDYEPQISNALEGSHSINPWAVYAFFSV